MTTSGDVIAALNQRRLRKSLRPEVPGQMAPGWQRWFDGQPAPPAPADGAGPGALAQVFLQRPLRAVPRAGPPMARWQAALSLLRQEWTPDPPDQRALRIGAGVLDILLHIALVILLSWLVSVRLLALRDQAPTDDGAVQVEFIGRGNAEAGGGAAAAAGAEATPAAAAPEAAATGQPVAPAAAAAAPVPAVAAETTADVAQAAQPLQVSEVPAPEADAFQLPPPQARPIDLPQVELRDPQPAVQPTEIAVLQPPEVRALQPPERALDVRVPALRTQARPLELPRVEPAPPVRQLRLPELATRDVQVPQPRAAVRDIPLPAGGAAAPSAQAGSAPSRTATAIAPAAGTARTPSPAAGEAPAGSGQGSRPATQPGRGVAAAGPGAGPAVRPAPGGWPGAAKRDDWGASARNAAGTGTGRDGDGSGRPGLYNADGSARLPGDQWTRQAGIDIASDGSWLTRPGLEYRGTRFDRYWIPGGTLLQEWVRRGIQRVAIPIPGTGRRLECVISLLQLGGGCFPVSDNVNEQPATARPPPDIPFKPELQERNGSVPR